MTILYLCETLVAEKVSQKMMEVNLPYSENVSVTAQLLCCITWNIKWLKLMI